MRVKISKQPPPAPTASTIGPCPTVIQVSRTPQHRKFTQHLRTTRPPHDQGFLISSQYSNRVVRYLRVNDPFVLVYDIGGGGVGSGGQVVRWCWINFQCRVCPTYLDKSRARTYCFCSRCGWGLFGYFFSRLSFYFSFSLSLGDGRI